MNNSRRKAGFLLQETFMALTLSMALLVGVAQLMAMVTQQQRVARQRAVASQEVGNLMEQLVSRGWDDTTAADLSVECDRCLPDAQLAVDVEDESDTVRRIHVRIDWGDASSGRSRSASLVGWKFREKEGQS